jgi:hypothetical protein
MKVECRRPGSRLPFGPPIDDRSHDMEEINALREQLHKREAELLTLRLELIDSKITTLQKSQSDMEERLRAVETSRVRFETLAWLAFGGGALSLINVITLLMGKI